MDEASVSLEPSGVVAEVPGCAELLLMLLKQNFQVNTDEPAVLNVPRTYNIRSIPTLILFNNGEQRTYNIRSIPTLILSNNGGPADTAGPPVVLWGLLVSEVDMLVGAVPKSTLVAKLQRALDP
ncbi:hypothetical protein T484DRAFT_1905631 [Baffinella frigidus]|nr:hypothetical protein T484DRAFT_1905631 [Cryptophyta sp. CCMP2293]